MLSTKQKSDLLFKHYLGAGSTRDNREFFEEAIKSSFVVRPDQLWTYSDRIPDGTEATGGMDNINYIINMGLDGRDPIFYHYISEDQDKVPLVKRYIDLPLTMIDKGTDNAFLIADENGNQIKDIIPFNYYEEYYNYILKTADGKRIPFGVGDWNVDTYSGIVTFYGELPDGVDHEHPPLISFYQYVGGNGFRQDTYGYDGAILPLDNVEIAAGSCAVTNGSEGRTLYQHIVDKANEIQNDFVDTFGWDGADKNEGIALSFEKVIPLTYTSNQDAVKGYDQASNSEIGTLLSNKTSTFEANDNYEIVFASQKLDSTATYRIEIAEGVATGYENDDAQDPVNITGNEWGLYKVWLNDHAFVVLKVKNVEDEVLTFTVSSEDKVVTALLLYWSDQDKQYQPFLPKEDLLGNFGFPVVTINGRLPPSVQLGTAALATFSDVITPDYYGPRTFAVVIAKEDGTDVKSADYIVKNKEDWYLNDILEQIKIKYGKDLKGTIYLRAGHYVANGDIDISMFSNVIFEGDNFATTIDLGRHALVVKPEEGEIAELCHARLANVSGVEISAKGVAILSDLNLTGTDIELEAYNSGKVLVRSVSANNVHIFGEQDAELPNVDLKSCFFNKVTVEKNKTYLSNNTINEVSVVIPPADTEDNTMVLRGNVINKLATKYDDLFIDNNMIFHYKGIAGSAANQIPVGTPEDHTILNGNKDELTTTGRFPIFSKDDFLHMKYAEFASPFYYNKTENIIELLYDTEVIKIVDGKLTTVIKSDRIAMSDVVFDRHENSELDPVAYNNSHTINDVFRHIYMWKADLDPNGKIPLQELPDSVAYGGLLYVGTWSFEQNNGYYPSFSDAAYRQNISKDNVVDTLQKGWFFIVQEALDTSDTDADNDTPVAEQTAKDGTVFTAGDWVIYVGDGSDDAENENSSWQKIDRAYSDPTYSPLPYYAKVPEVENLDWYWKKNRKGGALDLSGDTIIEAFKKVNDELRKLQPKKPMNIGSVPFEMMKEYDTVSYRNYSRNGVIGGVVTSFDSSKVKSFDFQTRCLPDGTRTYQELIFFGDEAKLTVNVDNTEYEFIVGVDRPAQEQGPVYVSKATEAMTYADHGEGYWQGIYIIVKNGNLEDGVHTVHATIDDVKVIYDDRTDTSQFQNDYEGSSNVVTYNTFTPYFPANVVRVDNTYVGIAEVPIADLATDDMCSGIRKINIANFKKISGIELRLDKIYKDWNVPTDKLAEVKVLLNDDPEKVFCETTIADDHIVLEDSGDGVHQNLYLENFEIPVTYENKDDILPYSTTLDFYITVYDLYNEPHEIKFYSYTGIRFDPTTEDERCKAGNLDENSSFKDLPGSFGGLWDSSATCVEELTKIGELVDGKPVGVYQQPQETYWVGVGSPVPFNPKTSWKGHQYGEDFYGVACFNIGHIEDATGFVFKIEGLENDLKNYTFDKLSGSTNDVILQVCLVDPDELEHSNAKVTAFLDADNPYDGFTPVKENVFETPVMYAGNSTATEKRVTFGRNKILSGDVYVRIGIKKDSGLRFTGIKLIEEI